MKFGKGVNELGNACESICKRWKDLQPNGNEKRLERFGEVGIADETNGFGLYVVKKTDSGFRSVAPDVGAAL